MYFKNIAKKLLGIKPPVITRTIEDEFIKWLRFANAGMLHDGNVYCFDYAIRNLPSDAPLIEIGSFCGLSTNVIAYFLAKYQKNNKIITADKWYFEGYREGEKLGGHSFVTHTNYRNFVIESYKHNVQTFSNQNLPHTIEQFSDDFFELWNKSEEVKDVFGRNLKLGGSISFAYIDGNHTYEFTKRDFQNTDKYLEKGGFILFDDSSDNDKFGSAQFVKELLTNPNYELVIKNPNYFFRKIL